MLTNLPTACRLDGVRLHEKAKKDACFVVSAAGLDSIAADHAIIQHSVLTVSRRWQHADKHANCLQSLWS